MCLGITGGEYDKYDEYNTNDTDTNDTNTNDTNTNDTNTNDTNTNDTANIIVRKMFPDNNDSKSIIIVIGNHNDINNTNRRGKFLKIFEKLFLENNKTNSSFKKETNSSKE